MSARRWTLNLSRSPNAQMVYIASWQQFQEAAENLYEKSPNSVSFIPALPSSVVLINDRTQTRYCIKWKSSEAMLVLKVTDNTTVSPLPSLFAFSLRGENESNVSLAIQCLKFKTYSSAYLNRFEALNLTLMRKMQNRKRPDPSTSSIPVPVDPGTSSKAQGESSLPTQPVQGGGIKKKKAKKKK